MPIGTKFGNMERIYMDMDGGSVCALKYFPEAIKLVNVTNYWTLQYECYPSNSFSLNNFDVN